MTTAVAVRNALDDEQADATNVAENPSLLIQLARRLAHGGERNCCSGLCSLPPCLDKYGPKKFRCCGLLPPRYEEIVHKPYEFFEQVMPQLSTGDLFFWSYPCEVNDGGEGLQRCMSETRWTHIGMVYRPSDCPNILKHTVTHEKEEQVHPFHPSRPQLIHMLIGCKLDGFNLTDFEEEAKALLKQGEDTPWVYMIGIRFLEGVRRDEHFYQTIEEKVNEYWDSGYDMVNIRKSALDLCDTCDCFGCMLSSRTMDDGSMFCSDMVADIYQALGLLDEGLIAKEFTPGNFDSAASLPLRNGASLSKEHVVVGPNENEESSIDSESENFWDDPNYNLPIPVGEPKQMSMRSISRARIP